MPILRRNLKCFYCGSRTNTPWNRGLFQFDCDKCGATNHLDDKGQIADPPAIPAKPIFQPAKAPASRTSPEFEQPTDPLFCSTCLTNQQLYTRTLAEYFPDESHPDYAKFEASYDTYKKGLEQRYPQVCADCEPRVRARMKQASYAAKTDHLRRMMDNTKKGLGWRTRGLTWRWLLLTLGCFLWWTSMIIQGLWHVAGAAQANDITEYDYASDERTGWRRCFLPVEHGWKVKGECQSSAVIPVEWSLIAALLSFWWNPKLKEKIRGRYVKLVGLTEHFWLQVIVVALRALAWRTLRGAKPTSFPPQVYQGVHAVMAAFMLLTAIASLRTVQIDKRPRKLFDDNIQPLLSAEERQQHITPDFTSQSTYAGTFPLHMLDSRSRAADPLTPPPDDDAMSDTASVTASTVFSHDSNQMDWEPTERDARFRLSNLNVDRAASFAQQQREQTYNSLPTAPSALGGPSNRPSPFFGTLPAQPKGITPKGRQILRPAPFNAPTEEKKQNFFAQVMSNGAPSTVPGVTGRNEFVLEQPRLPSGFAGDHQDTGLEDLFDRVFVGEEPPEVRAAQGRAAEAQEEYAERSRQIRMRALVCLIPLLVGIVAVGIKVSGWIDNWSWDWPAAATHPAILVD